MSTISYLDEYYYHPSIEERKIFSDFLEKQGLEYEKNVEMTLKVVDKVTGEMIGTGSIDGKVIKCLAIHPKKRGEGLSAHILSLLVRELINRGRTHIFVFTDPKNILGQTGNIFSGFRIVAETNEIILLEMGSKTINDFLKELKDQIGEKFVESTKLIGSIIVNCNPFTFGHQYLIEYAANECDFLIVFVVAEDRSVFPTKVRYELVKKGTKHLTNVLVVEGGDYIISPATFPRYFMKESDNISLAQARLDVTIFANYIAPSVGITRRYVGDEPYCAVTNSYNQAMKEILLPKGIDLKIIPRKEFNGEVISASHVRNLIKQSNFELIKQLVPSTTFDFLLSEEAKPIIEKIKKRNP